MNLIRLGSYASFYQTWRRSGFSVRRWGRNHKGRVLSSRAANGRFSSLLACLLALVSCSAAVVYAEDIEPTDVRVMSFNIRFGTADDGENSWPLRREFLIATIKAFGPDLLGTQETLGFQKDYLREQLGDYEVLGVGRNDGKEEGEMMALYYKAARFESLASGHFWLSASPEQVGSKSWDSSLPRMATWVKLQDRLNPDQQPIFFVNTHFDHQGAVARLESAKLMRRQILQLAASCSVVLTGDFNIGEGSEPFQALFADVDGEKSPVVDTYRVANPHRELNEGTFSAFRAAATNNLRIDWIGVSRDWRVLAATIDRTVRDGRAPSDHFPVTSLLRRAAARD